MNSSSQWPNILVVDDVKDNCELIQIYLTTFEQVNVITAFSGEEALNIYKKMEFALIILDIDMPKMDGFELARQMKILKNDDKTPLIYLSGNPQNTIHVGKGYELGAVDYILKPFDLKFVLQKVRVFLNLFQQKKALEKEVTIKTNSENRLIKENQASHAILEDSQECICTFNVKGRIETINLAGVNLLQADKAEFLIGVQFSKLVYLEDIKIFLRNLNQALNGETVKFKLRVQTVQNNLCGAELSLSPIIEEDNIKRIVCIAIKSENAE